MRLRNLVLPLALALALPAHAQSPPRPELAAEVEALLGGIDDAPAPDDWRALGPGAAAVLLAIAADPQRRATERARAVAALRYFPDAAPELRELVERDRDAPDILLRKALGTLAVTDPDGALALAARALGHDDVATREAAVRALAVVGTDDATAILRLHLELESSVAVREEIGRALELSPAPPAATE